MVNKLRIAHIGPFLEHRITGPKNSVTMLSKALSECNDFVSNVYTFSSSEDFNFNGVAIKSIEKFNLSCYDIVVFPGLFGLAYYKLGKILKKKNIPYVVSPRSSLMKPALYKSFFKKTVARYVYVNRFLKDAASIHFLTEDERNNSIKENDNFFVCGNGVDLNGDSWPDGVDKNRPEKQRVIGYLGRYDINHKGLDLLVKAVKLAEYSIRESNIKFAFRGADFNGGANYLTTLIKRFELDDLISIGGPVFGKEKLKFLAECMAFVHTSRYEGQPQAVMEALAAGTPALLTPGTNMQKFIIENNMGWVCGHSTKDIADGLIRISQCKQEEFEKLSQNAAIYAYKNFRWDVIARSFGESLRNYSCHKV